MSCLLLVISIFPFLSAGFLLVPMLSLLHLTLQLQAYQPTWCHLLFLLQAILLPCSPPNLTLQPPAFLFYCLIKQLINTTLHVSVDCVCFKKCASESPDQICLCVQIKWPEPDSVLLSPPTQKTDQYVIRQGIGPVCRINGNAINKVNATHQFYAT